MSAVEQHVGTDTIAARVMRGVPVDNDEYLGFVRRLQHREIGTWRPEHSSWRNGGGHASARSS